MDRLLLFFSVILCFQRRYVSSEKFLHPILHDWRENRHVQWLGLASACICRAFSHPRQRTLAFLPDRPVSEAAGPHICSLGVREGRRLFWRAWEGICQVSFLAFRTNQGSFIGLGVGDFRVITCSIRYWWKMGPRERVYYKRERNTKIYYLSFLLSRLVWRWNR